MAAEENNSNPRMHPATKKHEETARLSKKTRNTHRLHAKFEKLWLFGDFLEEKSSMQV